MRQCAVRWSELFDTDNSNDGDGDDDDDDEDDTTSDVFGDDSDWTVWGHDRLVLGCMVFIYRLKIGLKI